MGFVNIAFWISSRPQYKIIMKNWRLVHSKFQMSQVMLLNLSLLAHDKHIYIIQLVPRNVCTHLQLPFHLKKQWNLPLYMSFLVLLKYYATASTMEDYLKNGSLLCSNTTKNKTKTKCTFLYLLKKLKMKQQKTQSWDQDDKPETPSFISLCTNFDIILIWIYWLGVSVSPGCWFCCDCLFRCTQYRTWKDVLYVSAHSSVPSG